MIKKIIPVLTSCLALSPLAHATMDYQKPNGWYVEGSLGSFFNNPSFNNPVLAASLGYKNGHLRAEGQYSYRSYTHYFITIGRNQETSQSLGLNGFFDFDNRTIFSPYIGLGMKYQLSQYNWNPYYSFSRSRFDNFVPVAHVGIRAYLNENLALDLGYHGLGDNSGSLGLVYHF